MALIKCPECGKEVSDKSKQCIHCEYPFSDASPKYVLSLDRFDYSRDGIAHINIVDFLLGKQNINLS